MMRRKVKIKVRMGLSEVWEDGIIRMIIRFPLLPFRFRSLPSASVLGRPLAGPTAPDAHQSPQCADDSAAFAARLFLRLPSASALPHRRNLAN